MLHPIYSDDEEVRRLTQLHLDAGRTVLQMFQLADSEENHSLRVLDMLRLPEGARILSLGCGVGGMEKYWYNRQDKGISFELVNLSQAQLDLCVCPGKKVRADAQHYRTERPSLFDVTVLAYLLGHVDAELALESAKRNTRKGGTVLVLDVFDGSAQFDSYYQYATCSSEEMQAHGFVLRPTKHPWRLMQLIHDLDPWVPRHVTPAVWSRLV